MQTCEHQRRRYPRLSQPIHGWYEDPMQPRMRRCRTIDISARGARLDGDRPLTPGREFTLYLEPEPGWQIKSTATVVRCHPAFAGERWLTAVSLRLHDSLDKSRLSFWLRRRRLMANKEAAALRRLP